MTADCADATPCCARLKASCPVFFTAALALFICDCASVMRWRACSSRSELAFSRACASLNSLRKRSASAPLPALGGAVVVVAADGAAPAVRVAGGGGGATWGAGGATWGAGGATWGAGGATWGATPPFSSLACAASRCRRSARSSSARVSALDFFAGGAGLELASSALGAPEPHPATKAHTTKATSGNRRVMAADVIGRSRPCN